MAKPIRWLRMACIFILMAFPGTLGLAENSDNNRNLADLKKFPLSQLQEDYDHFKTVIVTKHPQLYTDKAELEQLLKKQYQAIQDNMNELEFFRVLAPIVSKLNCGHTRLQFSPELGARLIREKCYLPLRLKIIQNKAYVWLNLSNAAIPAGSEILSINGQSVPDIVNILFNNMTADGSNLSRKYYELNHWFSESYFAYIGHPEKFQIRLVKPGAPGPSEVQLDPVAKTALIAAEPLREGELLPYSQQFKKGYALIKIQTFAFYDAGPRNQLKDFIDRFFARVSQAKIRNVILDLRDNWGGDPYCSSYLYRYLIRQPGAYFAPDSPYYDDLKIPLEPAPNHFQGNLYVLINGASFSSTGHLCSLLKYHHIGTFIGEETGGSFACTDGAKEVSLDNTQISFRYSTTAYKTAVSGLTPGRGIMPDYPVVPTIDDYIAGKDIEREFAITLIQKNGAD